MASAPFGVAFVGGGMMAQIGHIPFYEADPRVQVIGVVEERPSLQQALGTQLGTDRIFARRADILAHPDVDALVISAPRPATGPLTAEALNAGKHVLAEKPMAHTAAQAAQLVELAQAQDVSYWVGYMKLHDAGVIAARQQVREFRQTGRLGKLLSAQVYDFSKSYAVPPPAHTRPQESRAERYPSWPLHPDWLTPEYHDGYAWFLNSASHDVSLMRAFFPGELRIEGATVSSGGDAISALLNCEGIPISFNVAKTEAGHWIEGADFLFERGAVRLRIPSPMAVQAVAEVHFDDLEMGVVNEPLPTDSGWSFERQANAFITHLVDSGPAVATGQEGLADMVLIEEIWKRLSGVSI
ncbi:MAG: Gfo/Idh/MocA family oxidoreductase [Gammaproteobacteria bacterium]|nr:Gfo/Idh/MocA family oxidoreductase [Gammaproteobacteria bacterium]